jgi:hypothetical protein
MIRSWPVIAQKLFGQHAEAAGAQPHPAPEDHQGGTR